MSGINPGEYNLIMARVKPCVWNMYKVRQHWHALHKAIWLWLSRNPGMHKKDWPGWHWNGGNIPSIANYCFACCASIIGCKNCPIDWLTGQCLGHGYHEWSMKTRELSQGVTTPNMHRRRLARLALDIMNAPLKENNNA